MSLGCEMPTGAVFLVTEMEGDEMVGSLLGALVRRKEAIYSILEIFMLDNFIIIVYRPFSIYFISVQSIYWDKISTNYNLC